MPSERVQRRIEKMLDEADEAMDRSDWDVVHRRATEVLALDPGNQEAAQLLSAAESLGSTSADSESTPRSTSPGTGTASDQPTHFANGRYEVVRLLGEGGKKLVYLAHDTTLDRDVAFGLIKADGLDEASRERVTREAQAMARLGDNPHIMPIFDLGEENGQPYMVQPPMAGGDVEGLLADTEEGKLSLEDSLRIAAQICRGLEFAHKNGVIHRDLKPGNVWLTDDGTARVGDFGLAISLDRSRLTQEKMMVGTVRYMPPEQATGGEITPRADLYSLGAMLYEMVTGRTPFMGDDDIAIIGQHINTPPVAPQWHRPEIPATLDTLIMRLLSKNPAERPESAADVLSALEAIDIASADAEASSPSPLAGEGGGEGAGSLDGMASGVFVGRHAEMDQLKAKLEATLSGRGGMVTLVGEPGIGKTRTSLELETYAGLRNAQTLWGRCYEGGGAPPYWPWVQAIRSYVSTLEPDELRSQMGSTAAVISEIVEDVKQRLPETEPPSHLDDPESARFRLFDSITTFLKNAGQARPIILVLDDLHWADKPSLLLLEFFARELASSRVMIVGTYRDMELNRRHPLSVTLGELTRERLYERVLLRGLTRDDIARFIEIAAGVAPPRGLIDAVHTQTEGNPLFVTETVRLLIQEGDLTPEKTAGRDSWTVRIPEGVREVIGRRLDRLSERCNEVLTLAAIIGRQFRFPIIKSLLEDLSEDRLLDVLDEAIDARIIEEVPAEVGLYQFTHALMQETLTVELSLTRQVRMHANIAESLEAHYGADAENHAEELVEHFAQARTVLGADRFVRYSTVAGETALANFAFEAAHQYLDRAFRELGDEINTTQHAEIADAWVRAAIVVADPNLFSEIFPVVRRVVDYWRSHGEHEKAAEISLIDFRYAPFRFPEIEPILADAFELVEPGTILEGRLLARHGFVLFWEVGEIERGKAEMEKAVAFARQQNAPALEMAGRLSLARIGEVDRDAENALENARLARELAIDARDDPVQATAAVTQATLALFAGSMDDARLLSEESLRLGRKIGNRVIVAASSVVAGRIAYSEGRFGDARNWVKEANYSAPGGRREMVTATTISWHLGELDTGIDELRFLSDETEVFLPQDPGWMQTAISPAAHGFGLDLEVPDLERLMRLSEDGLSSKHPRWIEEIALALTSWALLKGDTDRARKYRESIPEPTSKFSTMTVENYQRLYGNIAARFGEYELAQEHFEKALEQCGQDFAVERVHTCYQYSQMLIERDSPGDRDRVTALQDEAIELAGKSGMKTLLERVLAQREILKA